MEREEREEALKRLNPIVRDGGEIVFGFRFLVNGGVDVF
jgi:hypothetical protein